MKTKKKLIRSVERKGMIEVKNTGKGQSQGQAVNINIKIGDTSSKKKKDEEDDLEKKKAKKRRATKRAKKKLIETIQEELRTIQNLKQQAKELGVSIPAELGALPSSVPTTIKGLVAFQLEMSNRVITLQQYIESQNTETESQQIQPRIIPRTMGIPAPPIDYQLELDKTRQMLVEKGNIISGKIPFPIQPGETGIETGETGIETGETDAQIQDRIKKEREMRERIINEERLNPSGAVAGDDSIGLVGKLLDNNIKEQKKKLKEKIKKGEMTQAEFQIELKKLLDKAQKEEDSVITAKLGVTEQAKFTQLKKDKKNYERKAKQIATDIIKATKAKKSTLYVISKRDVEELEFEREDNLTKSQDYQTKYARLIGENADIFGDFFRESDILYQPNTTRGLIKAFVENTEKSFGEVNEDEGDSIQVPSESIESLKREITEIRMETNEIVQDIRENLTRDNQKASTALVNRVQNGVADTSTRWEKLKSKLIDNSMSIDKNQIAEFKRDLIVINGNRSRANKFLIDVKSRKIKMKSNIPIDPIIETALKRLKEYIALKGEMKETDYASSGFKNLIGNKPLWDAIFKLKKQKAQFSNLQQQLDSWTEQNPQYESDAGVPPPPIVVELPFRNYKLPPREQNPGEGETLVSVGKGETRVSVGAGGRPPIAPNFVARSAR